MKAFNGKVDRLIGIKFTSLTQDEEERRVDSNESCKRRGRRPAAGINSFACLFTLFLSKIQDEWLLPGIQAHYPDISMNSKTMPLIMPDRYLSS